MLLGLGCVGCAVLLLPPFQPQEFSFPEENQRSPKWILCRDRLGQICKCALELPCIPWGSQALPRLILGSLGEISSVQAPIPCLQAKQNSQEGGGSGELCPGPGDVEVYLEKTYYKHVFIYITILSMFVLIFILISVLILFIKL